MGFGRSMLGHWALDPAITYLNHGTVGATPRRVLVAQQKLRDEMERQPSRFLLRELTEDPIGKSQMDLPRMRAAANRVARFVGADSKDLVFVDNSTSGINAVLRSIDFQNGDEVLIPNHAYGAVRNAALYATRVRGAEVRTVEFPHVVSDPEHVVDAIEAAITPRTRLALIDHITSESALVLPIAEIATRCHKRGVTVLCDGAHAPGAIPLDIPSLGVDWYAGNLHKWAWSPRSSAILWVNPAKQGSIHHPVISWGLDQGMTHEFDWPGTRDPTSHLAASEGIEFMRELGVDSVQRYNHELAWSAGQAMSARWKSGPVAPESMIGTMISVPLPQRLGSTAAAATSLRDDLLFEHNIEIHVYASGGQLRARVSAQIYNDMEDIERLCRTLDMG